MHPTSTLGVLPRPTQLPPWRLVSAVAAARYTPAQPHKPTARSALRSHSPLPSRTFAAQPKQLCVPEQAKLRILDPPDIFEWPSKGKKPSSPCPKPEEGPHPPEANEASNTEEGVEQHDSQQEGNEEEHSKRSSSSSSRLAGSRASEGGESVIRAGQVSVLTSMHYLVGVTSKALSRMFGGWKSWSRVRSVFSISWPAKDPKRRCPKFRAASEEQDKASERYRRAEGEKETTPCAPLRDSTAKGKSEAEKRFGIALERQSKAKDLGVGG